MKKELKMTDIDLAKLRFNNNTSIKVYLIFFVTGLLVLYFTWNKDDISLRIVPAIFLLLGLIGLLNQLLGLNKKRDLNKKIKVVIKTNVIDKKVISSSSGSDDGTFETTYKLFFENSKYYHVKKFTFSKIQIGDKIELEYAKHSKWILNIHSNSLNIENNSFLQKY